MHLAETNKSYEEGILKFNIMLMKFLQPKHHPPLFPFPVSPCNMIVIGADNFYKRNKKITMDY